jgi:Domain of unknown function (DUF1906)
MTLYVADFYSDLTTAAQILAAGFSGASCYLSHQEGKAATVPQVAGYREAGLFVPFNFEDSATNALDGYVQGQRDAAFAANCAEGLGDPHGDIISFSVDFQAVPAQYPTIVAYFQGVETEIGPYLPADYGSFYVAETLYSELGLYGWQTAAWSWGLISSHAYLYQSQFGWEFDSSRLLFNVPLWGLAPDPTMPPMPAPLVVAAPPDPDDPTEETDMNPFVVVAEGPTAGSLGKKVTAGQCYIIWPEGFKTLQALGDAVNFAHYWGQRPLPGDDGCEKRTCAGLAAIPNR